MAKVTGIGGVFFKAHTERKNLEAWYQENLGLELKEFGAAVLNWSSDTAEDGGATHWCIADRKSEWFSPSPADFMINYRIDDMEGIIRRLNNAGTELFQGPETHSNGIFAWIIDPDGNKVELWEPKLPEEPK